MNPYAAQLGRRDPFEVIAATPALLEGVLARLGATRVEQPVAAGKWSPRQIAAHLADCEIAFGFRLRQAYAEDRHVIQPFDQDRWAASYAGYTVTAALETFKALRAWNRALLRSLPSSAFEKTLVHPERGEMPYRALVETIGGHDLNHLAQLEGAAASASGA